ncbi:MAG: HAD hydrolase-like protein [Coriobacteriales bacterium]|nr:HAD hydrolase-like protein [Coriobacteriales bacterium]
MPDEPPRCDIASRTCILFDFDGTLANTVPAILATGKKVLTEYGMTEEEMGDMRRLIGPPLPYGYCEIYGMSLEDAQKVTAHYRELYNV